MRSALDDRIDQVASALTAAPAPSDLKARVLADVLDRPRAARWWSWRLVAVPVAVVIVAVVLMRFGSRNAPQVLTNAPPLVLVRGDAPRAPGEEPGADPGPTPVRATRVARGAVPAPRPPDVDLALAPITLEPMQMPALAAPEVSTPESIGVAPLTLTPLSPEGAR